jgi:hypothetical protein
MYTFVIKRWRSSLISEFRIVGAARPGHPTCLAQALHIIKRWRSSLISEFRIVGAARPGSFQLSNNVLRVRLSGNCYTPAEPSFGLTVSSSTWETASFSGYVSGRGLPKVVCAVDHDRLSLEELQIIIL